MSTFEFESIYPYIGVTYNEREVNYHLTLVTAGFLAALMLLGVFGYVVAEYKTDSRLERENFWLGLLPASIGIVSCLTMVGMARESYYALPRPEARAISLNSASWDLPQEEKDALEAWLEAELQAQGFAGCVDLANPSSICGGQLIMAPATVLLQDGREAQMRLTQDIKGHVPNQIRLECTTGYKNTQC